VPRWGLGPFSARQHTELAVVSEPTADGQRALRITTTESAAVFLSLLPGHSPKVRPDAVYTLSVRATCLPGPGRPELRLLFDGGGDNVLSAPRIKSNSSNAEGFTDLAVSFMTGPAQTRLLAPGVRISGRGTVVVAEFCLRPGGRYEPRAGEEPVGTDAVRPVKHRLPAPSIAAATERFESLHQQSEQVYRGDGQWEGYRDLNRGNATESGSRDRFRTVRHPLIRCTAQRVIGYLAAWSATRKPVYETRAREGLQWLLSEQQPDGGFLAYLQEDGALHGREFSETGAAGVALVEGYVRLGDDRYLAAARRVCDYATVIEPNRRPGYNMMLVWTVGRYAEVSGDHSQLTRITASPLLTHSLDYQRSWGGFPAGRAWLRDQAINVLGLATVVRTLPHTAEHEQLHRALNTSLRAAVNCCVKVQLATGALASRPAGDREAPANAALVPALIAANGIDGIETGPLLSGVMVYYGTANAGGNRPNWTLSDLVQAYGLYLQYIVQTEDL